MVVEEAVGQRRRAPLQGPPGGAEGEHEGDRGQRQQRDGRRASSPPAGDRADHGAGERQPAGEEGVLAAGDVARVQPAPDAVVLPDLEVRLRRRLPVLGVAEGALEALLVAHLQVGQRQRHDDQPRHARGDRQPAQETPAARASVGDERRRQRDPQREGELEGDVEAGDDLDRRQQPEGQRRPPGAALEQQDQRVERPGGPGVAQLVEVPQVGVAVGQEGVGQPGQEAGGAVAGDVRDEQVHPAGGQHEAAEDEQVVGEDRVMGDEVDRPGQQRRGHVRVAERQRVLQRVEGVGVVEVQRVGRQRVLHPARDPDLQDRVRARRRGVPHARGQRPGHQDGRGAVR